MSSLPIKSIYVNRFDGGMTDDPRDEAVNIQRVIQHFDNYTRAYKLTPYRDMVADIGSGNETALETFNIKKVLFANGTVYGLGLNTSTNHTQFYQKVSTGDPTTAWTSITAATDASDGNTTNYNFFLYYHKFLYCDYGGGVSKYDIVGASFTFNDTTSFIPTAQGIVHSKDDTMYVPSANVIWSNLNGSWNSAITLPEYCTISSICEYGNYLAIAANQLDGTCTVYLWDRNASLTTLPEIIHWGAGTIQVIEIVAGVLCGVSQTGINNFALTPHVMIKSYDGTTLTTIKEFACSSIAFDGSVDKQVYNNIFYFLAEMTIDGTVFRGLWKIFKNPSGQLAVSFDILPRNNTALGAGSLNGFCRAGDYIIICYQDPTTGNPTIWRSDQTAIYTTTCLATTAINPSMPVSDRPQKKLLVSVGATYEALPAGAQALIQYRIDGGNWVTMFTETTTGQVRTEPVSVSGGGNGTEIEFQVQSTGGAEITGILYKYILVPTNE